MVSGTEWTPALSGDPIHLTVSVFQRVEDEARRLAELNENRDGATILRHAIASYFNSRDGSDHAAAHLSDKAFWDTLQAIQLSADATRSRLRQASVGSRNWATTELERVPVTVFRVLSSGAPGEVLDALPPEQLPLLNAIAEEAAGADPFGFVADTDALAAVRRATRSLREDVLRDLTLATELKEYILRTLYDLEQAVDAYQVNGVVGLRSVIERAIGRFAVEDLTADDERSASWLRRLGGILKGTVRVARDATFVVESIVMPGLEWIDSELPVEIEAVCPAPDELAPPPSPLALPPAPSASDSAGDETDSTGGAAESA